MQSKPPVQRTGGLRLTGQYMKFPGAGGIHFRRALRLLVGGAAIWAAKPKKKDTPCGVSFFLVDDIGFEPMTSRTSSGCSYQLS